MKRASSNADCCILGYFFFNARYSPLAVGEAPRNQIRAHHSLGDRGPTGWGFIRCRDRYAVKPVLRTNCPPISAGGVYNVNIFGGERVVTVVRLAVRASDRRETVYTE